MKRILGAAALIAAVVAAAAPASAQLREKWCSKVNIRFFVGGAEGDAFGTIVYNGARQAAADTGAHVDYLFSGWDREKMIQQLREAVAAHPDGIAMMGHPGPAAITPLAKQAADAGIKMMYQNVDVPDVRAQYGGGYIGTPNLLAFGRKLGAFAVKKLDLKAGDHALVFSTWSNEVRAARELGVVQAFTEAGLQVKKLDTTSDMAADPNLLLPIITAALNADPDVKVIGMSGGQLLGNAETYMKAARKKPGDVKVVGFDTSPRVVAAMDAGWVQLTADQEPFLQGYLPILSLCQQVVYGLAPLNEDTGAGFITPENYKIVGELAKEGLR
jgi:simple sugar transport system substrate-binding protein